MSADFVRVPVKDANHLAIVLSEYRERLEESLRTVRQDFPNLNDREEDETFLTTELAWCDRMQPLLVENRNMFDTQ